jgi:N-acetylneuraminic acid mutarotase
MKANMNLFWILGMGSVFLASCSKSSTTDNGTTDGNWISRSDFEGVARSEAVEFTAGTKAYIATGFDGEKRLDDLWQYDPDNNFWQQKAQFPGTPRSSAVAFSVADQGYVGTGYDGVNKLQDFWQYDPASNIWKQKADFGGSARYDAVAFSISGKGYVSTGFDGNYLKDIWEYDTAGDAWTQRVSLGGTKRSAAVAFVYKDKAYICTGINNGTAVNDFWVFDPSQPEGQAWTESRKIANISTDSYDDQYAIVRNNAVAFVMNDKAFVTTGENGSIYNDTWVYDFATDLWAKKTPYEGAARTGAVSFNINNRGFVLTGRSSTYQFDDIREFFPDQPYNAND